MIAIIMTMIDRSRSRSNDRNRYIPSGMRCFFMFLTHSLADSLKQLLHMDKLESLSPTCFFDKIFKHFLKFMILPFILYKLNEINN